MRGRVAVLLPLAVAIAWISTPVTQAQSAAPPPPRMFSPWYVEALRDIVQLEESDVARLEQVLASNPDDFTARLKLMAYHQRADRAGRADDRMKRAQHALWLIEHHPESEILHSGASTFARSELSAKDYQRAMALWAAAAAAKPRDAAILWNAASFFRSLDPGLHMYYLEATAAADPNHPFALGPLAGLYARSVLEGGPLSARALAGLEASKNVWVLSNAAYWFQSLYNQSVQMGMRNARAAELAERYFLRAKALDPNLDRQKILPQIDMQAVRRSWEADKKAAEESQRRTEAAVPRIPRLQPDAFRELPTAIVGALRARGCLVPQSFGEASPHNVIRGEFFAKGEVGWAVLCSVSRLTTLLVFRNDRDTNPATLAAFEDWHRVQILDNDQVGYSRQITAVGRKFIMDHYRAYGGPEPPVIDHQGIDDAFLEKASEVWYFYQGKWLKLTGAD